MGLFSSEEALIEMIIIVALSYVTLETEMFVNLG